MTRSLRAAVVLTLTAALAVPAVPASAASPRFPATIELAEGSQPEGIARGTGTTFYAGARADGAIYRGDVRTGRRVLLVEGREGAAARGLMLDRSTGVLWVAGNDGATPTVTAYDSRTGEQVRRIVVPGERFLNDVQVTRDAVYVTDSRNAELVIVTDAGATLLPLTGDYVQPSGFAPTASASSRAATS